LIFEVALKFFFFKLQKKGWAGMGRGGALRANFKIVLCGSSYHYKQLQSFAMRQSNAIFEMS